MIISKAFDVECFKNLFSVIFVDMKDYLDTFKDCVNEKGKPIPLTSILTVEEIKKRLSKVKKDVFWISDTDDSQLLELVAYINGMQARYDTKTSPAGEVYQIPIRHDLFGFNSNGYDDFMIRALLMYFNRYDSTKHLLLYLYKLSKKIIDIQKDKEKFFADKEIDLLKHYQLPYASIDLMQVYALNAAGVNVDKDSGERVKFGKGLKQTSINLQWHELLDFTLPPIDEEEANLYWRKEDRYRGMSTEQLNQLITQDFDRYVLPCYINPMLDYNVNDVYIVCEMARLSPDEIKLRYSLSNAFNIPVLSSARSNISDKLLNKFYSEMSGLKVREFKNLRTQRTALSFKKIIFPHIQFKTKILQDLLNYMKGFIIYRTANTDKNIPMRKLVDGILVSALDNVFKAEVDFFGTRYTLATGGIHSQDAPGVFRSTDEYTYIHWDYNSYYPSIMSSYNLAPKHLNQPIFTKMVTFFKDTRVKCKHTKDEDGLIIKGVPNKLSAEALKIVINAIYGKFGFDSFWLYDRFAQMQVTINGQLMTMTLVEALELEGIHVISANTDGIVIKLPNNKRERFKEITDEWNKVNKMNADGEEYELLIRRDVNNYFDIQKNGEIEFKGAMDPLQYRKNYGKGYDMPVVAIAVFEFFIHNTPVMETLRNHKNILDFCKTQNIGRQFDVVYDVVKDGRIQTIHSQRHVRFYVSNSGFIIQKEDVNNHKRYKLAGGLPVQILNSLDDKPIEDRNINYGYYYQEAYKIIDPIMLQISPNAKPNATLGTKSGKVSIKKHSQNYMTLFNDNDFN